MGKLGNMNLLNLFMIMLGVMLNTIAQLCLKQGMLQIGSIEVTIHNLWIMFLEASLNPFVIIGMICYVASFGVWLIVLSRVEVSIAYPMLSIGYVVTFIMAYYFWGESLSLNKIAGITLICIGVGMMYKA